MGKFAGLDAIKIHTVGPTIGRENDLVEVARGVDGQRTNIHHCAQTDVDVISGIAMVDRAKRAGVGSGEEMPGAVARECSDRGFGQTVIAV